MTPWRFASALLLALWGATTHGAESPPVASKHYDVVIYGGTSAGIAAAVQTVRLGKTAVVIEPRPYLGGLSAGGLGATDTGNKAVIGGVSREFYQRLKQKYDAPSAWRQEQPADFKPYRPNDDAIWAFEPHKAAEVFADWISESKLEPITNVEIKAVSKEGTTITEVQLSDGRVITGKRFIDATYEGDLLALAGVSYTVGREANSQYGETLNGVQKGRAVHHQFVKPVDPYVRPGDKSSGLLPGINTDPGEDGGADGRMQAYNYRLCITDAPENQLPFEKPDDYEDLQYELLLRNFEAGDLRIPLSIIMMPNRKTDVNNNFAVSTDWIGMNYDYTEGDAAERQQFEHKLKSYTQGLMWTLAHHERVPESIRKNVGRWGWAKDEWVDNDHWCYWPYIREGRRMVSDYVHSELDCRRLRDCPDPVGMGSYNMDSHHCQRYVDEHGHVRNEGDVQVSPRGPYLIAYRAIVPKREECTNLLVSVCISCSHIAYGSIRMEPVFMILGQSAATAACQSIDADTTVQDVNYATLRVRLDADKQVLTLPAGTTPSPITDAKSLPGIVVDDQAATKTGDWGESTSVNGFIGASYLHDGNIGQGEKSVQFEARIPQAGRYSVRVSYTANENRASNVPVRIESPTGVTTATINQKQRPPIDGRFVSLGELDLLADSTVRVTIETRGANGHVIADALQLLPVTAP